eukprot:CAMPEP_0206140074 /NCGR_PEP_ID=MMETSP1473-20131121/8217_1 /ASSEMBLY_ACC=CAM_ASM_001109 /TAXON_ID=1461547 /ORGANISM="Stichococcus sp, Strain RCC1054" /LENGTH=156 /DNA_ID=CAMNT_0053534075 /DNA_START=48 /DNA_END=516 /DNA_ORIENTATION=+
MQIARVCLNVDLSGARTVECFYARNLLHKHRAVRQKMPCFGQHTTIGENAREDKEDPNFGEDHEQLKSFEVFGVRGVNVVKLSITPRMISPSQVKGSKGEEDSADKAGRERKGEREMEFSGWKKKGNEREPSLICADSGWLRLTIWAAPPWFLRKP